MNIQMLHPAEQLARYIRRVYEQRLTTTSGGNISIKDDNGDMWITPGSIDKGSLTREDMVCVKPDGTVIGRHKPSSEYPFHLKIYETRKDLRAVLHAHSPTLVAFSIVRKIPDMALTPFSYMECKKAGMAKYAMTGSRELGERIAEVFRQGCDAAILENHGVAVGARNLPEAFGRFETLEYTARTQLHAAALGKIKPLDGETLAKYKSKMDFRPDFFEPEGYSSQEKAARGQICSFAARAYRQGLLTSVQGSFSSRVGEDRFVITPSHKDRLMLEPEDLAAVDRGRGEAGKELDPMTVLHGAIYKANPQINSVIICQPQYAMAFAVTDAPLDSRTIPESYIMMRDIPRLPGPALLEEPEKIAAVFNESTPIVLVENDCIIVTGPDMLHTFDRLEVTEYSAMSIVMSKSQGEMIPIDEKGLEEIRRGFDLK